jgi:hypothetical protein
MRRARRTALEVVAGSRTIENEVRLNSAIERVQTTSLASARVESLGVGGVPAAVEVGSVGSAGEARAPGRPEEAARPALAGRSSRGAG